MTREEAIEHIKNIKIFAITDGYYTDEAIEALAMATRSLEAWEKVRKELKEKRNEYSDCGLIGSASGISRSLDIIDKHLAEVSE